MGHAYWPLVHRLSLKTTHLLVETLFAKASWSFRMFASCIPHANVYTYYMSICVCMCIYIYIYTRLGYTFTCWWLGNHTCVLAVSGGVGCNNVHVHSHIMVMLRYEIVSSIWGGVGLGGVRWCNNIHVHLHWHLMLHCKIFSTVCINTWWYAVRSSLPSALTPDATL